MGLFERYLTVWVALAILAGMGAGAIAPDLFASVAALEYAQVNLVIAVLIWVMIFPMMVQIDFTSIKDVGKKPRGLVLTLFINCPGTVEWACRETPVLRYFSLKCPEAVGQTLLIVHWH